MRFGWKIASLMLALAATACSGAPAGDAGGSPFGSWVAEDIDGGGVIDDLQTTLTLGADGTATGSGGCNRYNGSAELDGMALSFGPLAATRMGCAPAVNDQEVKFFDAMTRVESWRLENGILFLRDAGGADILRFGPAS